MLIGDMLFPCQSLSNKVAILLKCLKLPKKPMKSCGLHFNESQLQGPSVINRPWAVQLRTQLALNYANSSVEFVMMSLDIHHTQIGQIFRGR